MGQWGVQAGIRLPVALCNSQQYQQRTIITNKDFVLVGDDDHVLTITIGDAVSLVVEYSLRVGSSVPDIPS
jgi:hypothetical protein